MPAAGPEQVADAVVSCSSSSSSSSPRFSRFRERGFVEAIVDVVVNVAQFKLVASK